jgi:hypothetical protein
MKKGATADANASLPDVVQLLVDAGGSDTVYADVYLRRARELLNSVLPVAEYNALKRIDQDIDEAIKQSKAATMARDWQKVETLAAKVEALRSSAREKAALAALGATVYDTVGVSIDPFSPGFESLKGRDLDLAELRDTLADKLKALTGADASSATFYEARRAFFTDLALLSKRGATKTGAAVASTTGSAELEQLAAQAAQQGDMAQLRGYARELLARRAKEAVSTAAQPDTPAAVDRATYQCPVDLAVPFSADVVQRARALGLAVARTEPVPQSVALLDYVFTRAWQPNLSSDETEREGAMRAEAMVNELGFPKEVSEPVKVLVGQFLRNPFVNSGGARYLPPFSVEEVLIEDFPEDQEPPAAGELLSALGLARRRSLARLEIDDALLEHGATILKDRLSLDPVDFRLVCIPHDLYMRFGRDRSWGRQQQWTHFDGYQVLKNGRLRALVGGDVRHGGLSDLVSIAITDQRDCVVARFAVIRRARQVARWR